MNRFQNGLWEIASSRDNAWAYPEAGTFAHSCRINNVEYQPFPQTHWSLVRRAGHDNAHTRREALTALLTRYESALRSYLCVTRRLPSHEADDLLQAFIADRLLESELLRAAEERRGRFRALLITSLRNFANSDHRGRRVRKTQSLDRHGVVDPTPPAPAAFESLWARALVNDVLRTMNAQCSQCGRLDVWTVFEERVLNELFHDATPTSYDELARRLQLSSPTQAANLLVTAKRMYARLLRSAVAEYERNDTDIDAEIRELQQHLSLAK